MPLIANVGREHLRVTLLLISITTILWIGVTLHLFPVWWMVTTSMKGAREVYKFPPTLWPKEPSLICYKIFYDTTLLSTAAYLDYPMYVYLKNSFIITGATMALQIPLSLFLAYGISKLASPRWSRLLFLLCVGILMIPGTVSIIPRYLLMHHFPFPFLSVPRIPFTNTLFPSYSFLNSYWAVILPNLLFPFGVLLAKGFFDTLPDEIINAARLDGSSEFGIFRRIILPLSKPIVAVISYFTFSTIWNGFMWPLIVLAKSKLWPFPVMMYKIQSQISQTVGRTDMGETITMTGEYVDFLGENLIMASAIIQSIPVFIMFIVFREQLMRGIKIRGFK